MRTRRSTVRLENKAVALEGLAIVFRYQVGQPSAAPFRHGVRQSNARSMQARSIKGRAADNGIVAERFRTGRQSRDVQRR